MERPRSRLRFVPALLTALLPVACRAVPDREARANAGPLPTIEAATEDLQALEGFLDLWWDEAEGRVLFSPPLAEESSKGMLYVVSLRAGLGSNDVGLDRGQLGTRLAVEFRQVGRRVLLVAPNLDWRDLEGGGASTRESFAESVLWGFDVVAESDERVLLDGTDFFLRDAHEVARKLKDAGQGDFELASERCAVLPEELRSFPDNSEIEVLQTFTSDRPGPEVRATAAWAGAVSLRVRHSFVRLPEWTMCATGAYLPRTFDPRCGYFPLSFDVTSAPVDRAQTVRWIQRHRPPEDGSPIVYYVDSAAPEPVRTALLEGARYWERAFDEVGLPGGFRVELLPPDADPLDVRYNVIQWVNRSTRGWSYGDVVTDPYTGEILEGHVTLGALRVRQDVLLAEGLLSPYEVPPSGALAEFTSLPEALRPDMRSDPRVVEMALARIRQLAAHEVGHTLGLAHNFAASVDGRASVMDYPAPLVRVTEDGELDLSDAYADGIGAWDELAIEYGYVGLGEANGGLADVLARMEELHFLTDADARGPDRAHPEANLWDNGAAPVEELAHTIEVRRIALEHFSEAAIRHGRPLATLEEVLVPVYFHHRYQVEAVARAVGGVRYAYTVRGAQPAGPGTTPVPGDEQRAALGLLMTTLEPDFLALPEGLRDLIPPRPPGFPHHRELVQSASLPFDPLTAAAASAGHTIGLLLDPQRARRLLDQERADPELPGLAHVLDTLVARAWLVAEGEPSANAPLRDEVRIQTVEHLLALARDERAPVRVRAVVDARLAELAGNLADAPDDPVSAWARGRIQHHFDDPRGVPEPDGRAALPPGAPIGSMGGSGRACGFTPPVFGRVAP